MEWKDWKPKYEKIVDKLNLDEESDRLAGHILKRIISNFDPSGLEEIIEGEECIIFGAGPSLERDLNTLERKGWLEKVLISADGATSAVLNYRTPDVIVTDLDGFIGDQLKAWEDGAWMVVHAHGDNIEKIREIVPKLDKHVLGSIQVDKPAELDNFGGFTDGDRAAFLANHFNASRIYLAGMDLGTEIGEFTGKTDVEEKIEKLNICKELLSWLSEKTDTTIINITSSGEKIPGIPQKNI